MNLKKSALSSIELSFFLHATEDEERFLNTIFKVLQLPNAEFEKCKMEGHFGNPILSFQIHLSGKDADEFAKGIANLLDRHEKDRILLNLASHIDKRGALYIRIDKQSLFSEKLVQSQVDAVRIKFKIRSKAYLSKSIMLYSKLLTNSTSK